MPEWFARLRDRFRRDRLDAELREELAHHRAMLERDAGTARPLGNVTAIREHARDRWSFAWLDVVEQDVRYALRGLRRSPGFTATVVLTLGLGIGANAAMFGMIDRLMFRPFAYMRDPASVNRVYLQTTVRGRAVARSVIPYTRYVDLTSASTSLSQAAAFTERQMAVGSGPAARQRMVAGVTASFFDFFDAPAERGRYFTSAEDVTPVGAFVVVLSHALWTAEFGARDVLGQTLQVGSIGYTIIGVAPAGFVGASSGTAPSIFIPATTIAANDNSSSINRYFTDYNWDWVSVIVRRKPGVSEEAAGAELTMNYLRSRTKQRVFNPQMAPDSLARPRGLASAIRTQAGPDAGLESRTLLWVTGVAVIVLVIACANVTNLMFARVLRRRREIAMRIALGVSRRRLVGQFLTESLLLALLGCVAGLAIAQWGGAALRVLVSNGAAVGPVYTDWRTLGFAAAFALAAGLATTVGPVVLALRENVATTLRAGAREGTYQRSRMRSVLLVTQGALSVILLVGAGLFVQSLGHVRDLRLGYEPERVLRASPDFRGMKLDSAARVASRRQLLSAAQAIPGVAAAARVSGTTPFFTSTNGLFVHGIDSVSRLGRFNYQAVTQDYFTVMGTRIVRGRGFSAEDREGSTRVVVVSESMARALWPGTDAVGQCIYVSFDPAAFRPGYDPSHLPCVTVVGISEDVVLQSMTEDQRLSYALPLDQTDPAWGDQIFLRVANAGAVAAVESVRRELQKSMPGDGFVTVSPLQDVLDSQRRSWQLGATMFVAFGVLALLVAAVGLYGVIAYNVAQRMHELGVRVALGARGTDVVRLVVGQGVRFALAGVAVGLGVAWIAARWMQPLLFNQSATDPATYGVVAGAMIVVALVASAVPAVRASRADPNAALRSD